MKRKKKRFHSYVKPMQDPQLVILLDAIRDIANDRKLIPHVTVKLISLEQTVVGLCNRIKHNGGTSSNRVTKLYALYLHERKFCTDAVSINNIVNSLALNDSESLVMLDDEVSVLTLTPFRGRTMLGLGINVVNYTAEEYESRFERTIVGSNLTDNDKIFCPALPFHAIVRGIRCRGGLSLDKMYDRKGVMA